MLTVGESGGRWHESDPESDPEKLISSECKERWNVWNCVFMFVELPSGQDSPIQATGVEVIMRFIKFD